MLTAHKIHIDKKILKKSVFLFEFVIIQDTKLKAPPAVSQYIESNNFSIIQLNKSNPVQELIEKFCNVIVLSPNLFLLHGLNNERELLNNLEEKADRLCIASFTLACINKGHISSSWLKQI